MGCEWTEAPIIAGMALTPCPLSHANSTRGRGENRRRQSAASFARRRLSSSENLHERHCRNGARTFCYTVSMRLEFSGKIWYWRGPAPYYYVTVPEEQSADIKAISAFVTYGWGVIPVRARIGKT